MSRKRPSSTDPVWFPKRQRRVMTLHQKVELLDLFNKVKSFAAVARAYNVNESTVRYIKKKEAQIRKAVNMTYSSNAKSVSTVRESGLIKMEESLVLWIADCQRKNISVTGNKICKQAKLLYDKFYPNSNNQDWTDGPSTSSPSKGFQASKGWLQRFQKRYDLNNIPETLNSLSFHQQLKADAFNEHFESDIYSHDNENLSHSPSAIIDLEQDEEEFDGQIDLNVDSSDEAESYTLLTVFSQDSYGNRLHDSKQTDSSQILSDADLVDVVKFDDGKGELNKPENKALTKERLTDILWHLNEAKTKAMSWDPCVERVMILHDVMMTAIKPYQMLLESLNGQKNGSSANSFSIPSTKP